MEPCGCLLRLQEPDTTPILRHIVQALTSPSYVFRMHLILPSRLCVGLLSDLFPSGFPTKILYASHTSPPLPPYVPHNSPISFFLIDHPNYIWCEQLMKRSIMWSPLLSRYLVFLRPWYIPQHSLLEHSLLSLYCSLSVRDRVSREAKVYMT